MNKQGTVICIQEGIAKIKITRDSACGDNCAACGLCDMREMIVELPAIEGLSPGERVLLVSKASAFLKNSALGYLSLTALLILGAALGAKLGGEVLSFLLALAFAFLGLGILKLLPKKHTEIKLKKMR